MTEPPFPIYQEIILKESKATGYLQAFSKNALKAKDTLGLLTEISQKEIGIKLNYSICGLYEKTGAHELPHLLLRGI